MSNEPLGMDIDEIKFLHDKGKELDRASFEVNEARIRFEKTKKSYIKACSNTKKAYYDAMKMKEIVIELNEILIKQLDVYLSNNMDNNLLFNRICSFMIAALKDNPFCEYSNSNYGFSDKAKHQGDVLLASDIYSNFHPLYKSLIVMLDHYEIMIGKYIEFAKKYEENEKLTEMLYKEYTLCEQSLRESNINLTNKMREYSIINDSTSVI